MSEKMVINMPLAINHGMTYVEFLELLKELTANVAKEAQSTEYTSSRILTGGEPVVVSVEFTFEAAAGEREVWNKISANPRYEVSSMGRVRNAKTLTIKKAYADKHKSGYVTVQLYMGAAYPARFKRWYVHKLVAETFLGPSNGLTINHKDRNRLNNSVSNLEYVSQQSNVKHSAKAGAYIKKLTPDDVIKIRTMLSRGLSKAQIAELFKVTRVTVYNIDKGVSFKWVV